MNLRELPAKWKERWQNFSPLQKIGIFATTVGIVVSLYYLGNFLFQTKYAPLFTDMDLQQAGAVTEKLKAMNVKYQVTNEGKSIEVPEDQVYDLRMQMASQDALPGNGQGFELFDQQKMAQTDFEQQVVYQRALQEELRRTIVSVNAVDEARVHLVLPQKSVFIQDQGTASVSVVLKLKPLVKLQEEQVKGINNLLLGSVEGLKPENIYIIDTQGNVLNDFLQTASGPDEKDNEVILQQQQVREDLEKNMEKRIKQLLTPVFGPGKVVAMVTAQLDYSKAKTTQTKTLPGKVVSVQTTKSSGTNSGAAGVAGTTSQTPGTSYPSVTNQNGSYQNESSTTNYENGKEELVIDQPPGAIKEISVSVIVDSSVRAADQQTIQQTVATAIGYDAKRGDQITIQTMPFDTSAQDDFKSQEAQATKDAQKKQIYINIGIASLILILFIIALLIYLRKRKRDQLLQQQLALHPQASVPTVAQAESERMPPLPLVRDRKDDLQDIAKENPNEVAQVLKLWLKE